MPKTIHLNNAVVIRNTESRTGFSHSCQLIEDLMQHFNVPRGDENQDLLQKLAFFGICYHALFIELKGTPVRAWIDRYLSNVYAHNAGYPLMQTLEKFAALQETKGGK